MLSDGVTAGACRCPSSRKAIAASPVRQSDAEVGPRLVRIALLDQLSLVAVVWGEALLEEDQLERTAPLASGFAVSVATVEHLGGELAGGRVEVQVRVAELPGAQLEVAEDQAPKPRRCACGATRMRLISAR